MTPDLSKRRDVLSKLIQLVGLVIELPQGAEVTIEWDDAPPDLVLLLALQDDASLRTSRSGAIQTDLAEWKFGGVTFRARRAHEVPQPRPRLTLVKP